MSGTETSRRPGSRRRRRRGEGDGNRWLTTYADAVTLMLAFFILLYTMSEMDVIKFAAFIEGLREPFGNEAGDGLLPEQDGLNPDALPVSPALERPEAPDRLDDEDLHERPDPPDELPEDDPEDQAVEELTAQEAMEMAKRHTEALDQLDEVEAAISDAVQEHGLETYVEQRREERGLVVSIASDDVLFALGSTEIDELGEQVIEVVADVLDGFPNPLMVEGHTDDLPINRADYTNWNLSTDRAVAVLQRMIEEHELPADRVGAVGYGEYHPLETNDTDEGRARNRRVDIVVLIEEDEL